MERTRGRTRGKIGWGGTCIGLPLLVVTLAASTGCRTVEMTGRRQLLLMPEANEIQMGVTAFEETLSGEQPSQNPQYVQMVERVGQRIAQVAGRPDYAWEFRVIASPTMNAFCLPGGKVAVYEGILPICQTEAGLAVVMSHEVAHALARHGGERMSQSYMVNGVGMAVDKILQKEEQAQRERVLQAYGIASKYGFVLPYSRKHESEADHMGLMLMAQAGYDPNEAPRFWQRFGGVKTESQPEFFSTHPADERRAADLFALLPEALEIYQRAPVHYGMGEAVSMQAVASSTPPGKTASEPVTTAGLAASGGRTVAGAGQIARASYTSSGDILPPPLPPAPAGEAPEDAIPPLPEQAATLRDPAAPPVAVPAANPLR